MPTKSMSAFGGKADIPHSPQDRCVSKSARGDSFLTGLMIQCQVRKYSWRKNRSGQRGGGGSPRRARDERRTAEQYPLLRDDRTPVTANDPRRTSTRERTSRRSSRAK